MFKTLVSLGYHYGELAWGRQVMEEYARQGIKGGRDVIFYEVQNSDVETGNMCQSSLNEIKDAAKVRGAGLWLDMHCGFDERFEKDPVLLSYEGIDDKIIERAQRISDVIVKDWRKIRPDAPFRMMKYIGMPSAFADAFFSRYEYERKGPIYTAKLRRTVDFINQIHDIHQD